MTDEYLQMILTAPVYDVARYTRLDPAENLSRRFDNRIWLKREDTQPVFSFKLRGAYNLMISLAPEERARGVVTASAGNHAQGVALAAQKLQCRAIIVMPKTTPEIKVESVRRYEAEIVLHGNTYDEASQHAHGIVTAQGMTYVPPFDHPLIIAGQGTVGMEILRQHPQPIDAIFVPVGGGGLVAGIAAYVKQLAPTTRIVGVEPEEAACMKAAFDTGERVVLPKIGIFADGAAVRQVGEETLRLARQYVDEVLTVTNDEICAAIKDMFEDTRVIAEPAGALATAGLKQYLERNGVRNQALVSVFSGANVNFDRLRHIAELAELGEHREALLAVRLAERPGSFRSFCHAIGPRLVTEFNYRYSDPTTAMVFAGVRLKQGNKEKLALIENLRAKGYEVVDISANETAKMHVRYMVGGHGTDVSGERVLRVEFPERPGALLRFLNEVGDRWNISMFHYRNHGAAYGRVLMGVQVPAQDTQSFADFLNALDMPYIEETDNPAYRLFLG